MGLTPVHGEGGGGFVWWGMHYGENRGRGVIEMGNGREGLKAPLLDADIIH